MDLTNRPTDIIPADLVEAAQDLFAHARSRRTIETYDQSWRAFVAWARGRDLQPLPATPSTVIAYIVDHETKLAVSTIRKNLVAVTQAHRAKGLESPVTTEPVRLALKGLARKRGTAPKSKTALRLHHLRAMLEALPDSVTGVRDQAILLIGFAGGMRRSEIVGLDVEDLRFVPEGVEIRIARSKTDQEGQGRVIGIPRGRHEETCPVRALQKWLDLCIIKEGPVFFRLDNAGRGVRSRLTGKSVAKIVKKAAERACLDPSYFSAHSLRSGFCTESARAGAGEREIARTTGHRSLSVLRGYVQSGTLFEENAAKLLDL